MNTRIWILKSKKYSKVETEFNMYNIYSTYERMPVYFFLFRLKNYYKLSLRVFSNTFDNFYKS